MWVLYLFESLAFDHKHGDQCCTKCHCCHYGRVHQMPCKHLLPRPPQNLGHGRVLGVSGRLVWRLEVQYVMLLTVSRLWSTVMGETGADVMGEPMMVIASRKIPRKRVRRRVLKCMVASFRARAVVIFVL